MGLALQASEAVSARCCTGKTSRSEPEFWGIHPDAFCIAGVHGQIPKTRGKRWQKPKPRETQAAARHVDAPVAPSTHGWCPDLCAGIYKPEDSSKKQASPIHNAQLRQARWSSCKALVNLALSDSSLGRKTPRHWSAHEKARAPAPGLTCAEKPEGQHIAASAKSGSLVSISGANVAWISCRIS